MKIENEYVGILAFADDIALIANNYEQAQRMMDTLETVLGRYRLELNLNKTQYIANYDGHLFYQGNQVIRT